MPTLSNFLCRIYVMLVFIYFDMYIGLGRTCMVLRCIFGSKIQIMLRCKKTLTMLIVRMPKATQREVWAPDGITENPGGSTFEIFQESKPFLPPSLLLLCIKLPLPSDLTISISRLACGSPLPHPVYYQHNNLSEPLKTWVRSCYSFAQNF